MSIFYVDGDYVEDSKAVLPLTDLAVLRGYAVFDFLRTYNGRPFHLREHLQRLHNSAALLHLPCPWSIGELEEIVAELLRRNAHKETNLRFIVTGGDSTDGITPSDKPRLVVMATELVPYPKEWYTEGVRVITSEEARYRPGSKSTNYIKAIMVLREARSHNAIESLYVNKSGHLLEGTTSNFFVVLGDRLITPEDDILPGITRDVVIRLASAEYTVEKAPIDRQLLKRCDEAFLTSSNKEVVPVIQVDDAVIGEAPGPVVKRIMTLFRQYTESW